MFLSRFSSVNWFIWFVNWTEWFVQINSLDISWIWFIQSVFKAVFKQSCLFSQVPWFGPFKIKSIFKQFATSLFCYKHCEQHSRVCKWQIDFKLLNSVSWNKLTVVCQINTKGNCVFPCNSLEEITVWLCVHRVLHRCECQCFQERGKINGDFISNETGPHGTGVSPLYLMIWEMSRIHTSVNYCTNMSEYKSLASLRLFLLPCTVKTNLFKLPKIYWFVKIINK